MDKICATIDQMELISKSPMAMKWTLNAKPQTATGNNFKGIEDFYLKAKARMWP